MRFPVLASDYDGTLAHDGRVDDATLRAVDRLRASGRRFVLVTGRELPDLLEIFPGVNRCDRVVAENGALLYRPTTNEQKVLGPPPDPGFVKALKTRGVRPLAVGQVIVATCEPQYAAVLDIIHALALELQVIFNKGSVMVLPSGVNKATGLAAALEELGVAAKDAVAVGDAENDHAFLAACGRGAAVANALPALRERAHVVTHGAEGAGVAELIDRILDDAL